VKLMHAIKRALGYQDEDCRARATDKDQKIQEVDRRLHEQATRLHVLEWEAYGPERKQPKDTH
jgi:hypothetical protein